MGVDGAQGPRVWTRLPACQALVIRGWACPGARGMLYATYTSLLKKKKGTHHGAFASCDDVRCRLAPRCRASACAISPTWEDQVDMGCT